MKRKKFTGLILALSLAVTTAGSSVVPAAAQEWKGDHDTYAAVPQNDGDVNVPGLAKEATVTGNYKGGWGAVLDNVKDGDKNTAWNGCRDSAEVPLTESDWILYEFPDKLELTGSSISWMSDGGGVVFPKSITFEYYDAKSAAWKEAVPEGEWTYGGEENTADNTYNFQKIITDKIKLVIENGVNNDNNIAAAYIFEWALTGKKWEPGLADLQAEITDALSYMNEEEKYTAATFSAFKTALEAAQKAANESPQKEEIMLLIENLGLAIHGLKLAQVEAGPGLTEEKKALAEELSEAGKQVQAEFTTESWSAFDQAYRTALEVNDNQASTKEQIDQAYSNLRNALQGLVRKGSLQELQIELQKLVMPDRIMGSEIVLAQESENKFALSWKSDNEAIKIENGKGIVTRGEKAVTVKLTVTITGTEILTPDEPPASARREFLIFVPALYLAKEAAVTGSYKGGWNMGLEYVKDEDTATAWNGCRDDGSAVLETDWIQYDFEDNLELTGSVIRWKDDGSGVVVPRSISFQYYDLDSETWKEAVPAGEAWTYVAETDNVYNFEKIVTNKIRLNINNGLNSANATTAAFIYEWALTGRKFKISLEDLQAAIANAQIYKNEEEKYTAETFAAFKTALDAAEKAVDEKPSLIQIGLLLTNLETAIDGLKLDLVEPGPGLTEEKKVLAQELSTAGKKIKTDYTAESWAAFDQAYKEAMAVNDDEASTKEQIDAALAKLQSLTGELVRKGSLKELQIELQKLTMPDRILADEMQLAAKSPNQFALSWSSDHDAVKVENGKAIITRGEEAAAVKLTVTITGRENSSPDQPPLTAAREFIVIVPAVYLAKEAVVTGSYEGAGTLKLNNIKDENNSTAWNGWGRGDSTPDSDWIQYDFSNKLELTGSVIRWKHDGEGVVIPESISFQYYDAESQTWKEAVPAGEDWTYVPDEDNSYKFEKIVTDKIKLMINNGSSTEGKKLGAFIYEWGLTGYKWKPALTDLQAAIAAAKTYDADLYTEESYSILTQAVNRAETVVKKQDPAQTEITEAFNALQAAIQALEEKGTEPGPGTADKTKLAEAINAAPKEADKDKYTEESWAMYSEVYARVVEVNNNEEATQEQVNQAVEDLQAAILALVEKGPQNKPADFTALNKNIENARKYKAADYTAASYNALKTVLAEAEAVAKNANASQNDIDAVNTKLTKAVQGLVKLKIVSVKKVTLGVKQTYSIARKNCTYTTSNKKTAAVNAKGVVTAKRTGKVTVKAIGSDGKVKVYNITVKKAPGKITKVTPSKKTLKKGKKVTLKVKLPKGTAAKITFKSNKPKIASVNTKGVVKAKKKGTAKITVKTHNGKKKVVTIRVK